MDGSYLLGNTALLDKAFLVFDDWVKQPFESKVSTLRRSSAVVSEGFDEGWCQSLRNFFRCQGLVTTETNLHVNEHVR